MKRELLKLMDATGVFEIARRINDRRPLILTYHRFSDDGREDALPVETFRAQLEYLTRRYRLVGLSEIARQLQAGRTPEPGLAAITIDDGYSDAFDLAFPLLKEFDVPATLFVATDFVDGRGWLWTDLTRYLFLASRVETFAAEIDGRFMRIELSDRQSRLRAASLLNESLKKMAETGRRETIDRIAAALETPIPPVPAPEYSAVDWQEVRLMEAAGIEIGSHTVTHPILTRIDERQLVDELVRSRRRIEDELGHPIGLFCYPNGDYDRQVRDQVELAGYTAAVTCDMGLNPEGQDLLALKRIHTLPDREGFAQDVSGFADFKRAVRGMRPKRVSENLILGKHTEA